MEDEEQHLTYLDASTQTLSSPTHCVVQWLEKSLEYFKTSAGRDHLDSVPFASDVAKEIQMNTMQQEEEARTLTILLENFHSLRQVQATITAISNENRMYKSRFATDPLLMRRNFEQCGTDFLRVLIIALQNELSATRDVIETANIAQNALFTQLVHPFDSSQAVSIDRLAEMGIVDAAYSNAVEIVDDAEKLAKENTLLKQQLIRYQSTLRILGTTGGRKKEDQEKLIELVANSRRPIDPKQLVSGLQHQNDTRILLEELHASRESLCHRERTIQTMMDIEKKMCLHHRTLLRQNMQLGDLVLQLIKVIDPQALEKNDLPITLSFLKSKKGEMRQCPVIHDEPAETPPCETKERPCSTGIEQVLSRVYMLWGNSFAPPRWHKRLVGLFNRFNQYTDACGIDASKEKGEMSLNNFISLCQCFDIVPTLISLQKLREHIGSTIRSANSALDIDRGQNLSISIGQYLEVLVRIGVGSSTIEHRSLIDKVVSVFDFLASNDTLKLLPGDETVIIRPGFSSKAKKKVKEMSPQNKEKNMQRRPKTAPRAKPSGVSRHERAMRRISHDSDFSSTRRTPDIVSHPPRMLHIDANFSLHQREDPVATRRHHILSYFKEFDGFLLDSFVYYAKKAPPTIATAATFAQIAESKQNLTQGIFCQFLKEYKVIPNVIEKATITDIISAAPRWISFDCFRLRLGQIAQRASYNLREIASGKEKQQLQMLHEAFKLAVEAVSKYGLAPNHAVIRELCSLNANKIFPKDKLQHLTTLLQKKDPDSIDVGFVTWKYTERCYLAVSDQCKHGREVKMRAERAALAKKNDDSKSQLEFDGESILLLLHYITGKYG